MGFNFGIIICKIHLVNWVSNADFAINETVNNVSYYLFQIIP